jgi:hypothetical protein
MRPSRHALILALLFVSLFSQLPAGLKQYVVPTPNVWAQSGEVPVARIDRGLSGSRSGLMTRVHARTVLIDRNHYPLAAEVLIEDRKGAPLTVEALQRFRWNSGIEIEVKYWGPVNVITQMIVTLPE